MDLLDLEEIMDIVDLAVMVGLRGDLVDLEESVVDFDDLAEADLVQADLVKAELEDAERDFADLAALEDLEEEEKEADSWT